METVQKFEHVCHILKELYTVYTVELQFDLIGRSVNEHLADS